MDPIEKMIWLGVVLVLAHVVLMAAMLVAFSGAP